MRVAAQSSAGAVEKVDELEKAALQGQGDRQDLQDRLQEACCKLVHRLTLAKTKPTATNLPCLHASEIEISLRKYF